MNLSWIRLFDRTSGYLISIVGYCNQKLAYQYFSIQRFQTKRAYWTHSIGWFRIRFPVTTKKKWRATRDEVRISSFLLILLWLSFISPWYFTTVWELYAPSVNSWFLKTLTTRWYSIYFCPRIKKKHSIHLLSPSVLISTFVQISSSVFTFENQLKSKLWGF